MSEEKTVEVKTLIAEGKSQLECVNALLAADEKLEAKEALEQYKSAHRSAEAATLIAEEESKKASEAVIAAQAEVVAAKALENIKVEGILEKAIATGKVHVSEPEGAWKQDQAKMFRAVAKGYAGQSEVAELKQKFTKVWGQKVAGVVTDTDADGGFFVRPEFDMEVDKLVYERSALIEAMQIRRGGDKTEINSISTFDFTNRADQNEAFAETKPTFANEELQYRETGAIVPVSTYALEESEYDLVGELMDLAADAKIRHLEPAVTTGKVTDGDFFDGMRFKSGVTTSDVIDSGTGVINSKDLSNAYLAGASQTRNKGSYILDTRELCLLLEERDDQNDPIETVTNVNGTWIHKKTGRPIVVSDNMSRLNNALTSNAGGTDVGAFFADLSRFRIYQRGAMDIAQSDQIFFAENQIGFRFILRYKFGIPTNSLTSFVTIQGVKDNPLT